MAEKMKAVWKPCAWCKEYSDRTHGKWMVKTESNHWIDDKDNYERMMAQEKVSHTICPDCSKIFYWQKHEITEETGESK